MEILFDMNRLKRIHYSILGLNCTFFPSGGNCVQDSQAIDGFVFSHSLEVCENSYEHGIHSDIAECLQDMSETSQELTKLVDAVQQSLNCIESLMICYIVGLQCYKKAILDLIESSIEKTKNIPGVHIWYTDEVHQLKDDICNINDVQFQKAIDNIRSICNTAGIQNVAENISGNEIENIPDMHRLLEKQFYDVIQNDYLRSPEISSLRDRLCQIHSQLMGINQFVDDHLKQLENDRNLAAAMEFSFENLTIDGLTFENQNLFNRIGYRLRQMYGLPQI